MEIFDTELIEKIMRNDRKSHKDVDLCDCGEPEGEFPPEMPVGMAYVPMQRWEKIYDSSQALERGTIFKALDKPFYGERRAYDVD